MSSEVKAAVITGGLGLIGVIITGLVTWNVSTSDTVTMSKYNAVVDERDGLKEEIEEVKERNISLKAELASVLDNQQDKSSEEDGNSEERDSVSGNGVEEVPVQAVDLSEMQVSNSQQFSDGEWKPYEYIGWDENENNTSDGEKYKKPLLLSAPGVNGVGRCQKYKIEYILNEKYSSFECSKYMLEESGKSSSEKVELSIYVDDAEDAVFKSDIITGGFYSKEGINIDISDVTKLTFLVECTDTSAGYNSIGTNNYSGETIAIVMTEARVNPK